MHVSSSDVHPFHKYTSFTNAAVHNMTHMKITRSYYARQSSGLETLDHHDDDRKLVAVNCWCHIMMIKTYDHLSRSRSLSFSRIWSYMMSSLAAVLRIHRYFYNVIKNPQFNPHTHRSLTVWWVSHVTINLTLYSNHNETKILHTPHQPAIKRIIVSILLKHTKPWWMGTWCQSKQYLWNSAWLNSQCWFYVL